MRFLTRVGMCGAWALIVLGSWEYFQACLSGATGLQATLAAASSACALVLGVVFAIVGGTES